MITNIENKLEQLYNLSSSIEKELSKEHIDAYLSIYIQKVPIGISVLFEYYYFNTNATYYCNALLDYGNRVIQPTTTYEHNYLNIPHWVAVNFEGNLELVKNILLGE